MTDVFLALGSNIEPHKNLRNCLRCLETKFGAIEYSPVYKNPAVGFEGSAFLNMMIKIKTNLQVRNLRDWLRQLENDHGRDRCRSGFSNQTLDIDIVLFGNRIQDNGGIILPRKEILEQAYILKPLSDIAPRLRLVCWVGSAWLIGR